MPSSGSLATCSSSAPKKKPRTSSAPSIPPAPERGTTLLPTIRPTAPKSPSTWRPQIPVILQVIEGLRHPGHFVSGLGSRRRDRDDRAAGDRARPRRADRHQRQRRPPASVARTSRSTTSARTRSMTKTRSKQEWGVRPDQVVDFQALVGDSIDNVPGVPLVGPKKASALLQQFGTLEHVLANADKAQGAKLRENLKAFADQARISRQLVELNANLPITVDWEAARVKEPHRPRLHALFTELGFRRLADEMRARTLLPERTAGQREDCQPRSRSPNQPLMQRNWPSKQRKRLPNHRKPVEACRVRPAVSCLRRRRAARRRQAAHPPDRRHRGGL